MSVIFEGAEKARSKVNAYELAKDLATSNAVASVGATDVSEFQGNDPAIQNTLRWASSTFVDAGVSEPDIDPSFGEIVGAAFRQSNTVGSALASSSLRERLAPTINSEPLTPKELYSRVDRDGLLPHLALFRGARSEAEYEAIKTDVARELEDRKILDASGGLGFLTEFGAAALDLPSLIPGAAIARTAKLATRGKKIAAVEGALAGFAGSVAAEAALQGTQQLRTAEESVLAVAAGTVLSGAIGAGVDAVFGREVADKVSTRLDEARAIAATGNTSAGAQAVSTFDQVSARGLDTVDRVNSGGAFKVLEALEKTPIIGKHLASPARQLMQSTSAAARNAVSQLVSSPSISRANVEGVANAANVEAEFGAVKGAFAQAKREVDDLYHANKDAYPDRPTFNAAVARQLATKNPSGDPVVKQAAKSFRDRVFEPIRQQLVANGVFKPDELALLNSEDYFPVVYDAQSIIGDRDAFVEYHIDAFKENIFEDVRAALMAKEARASDLEDLQIELKGRTRRVPKLDEAGNPVLNPNTGKPVMTAEVLKPGKVREFKQEAQAVFKAEELDGKAELDGITKAFNADGPYTPQSLPSFPQFEKHFLARDVLRERRVEVKTALSEAEKKVREVRDAELEAINTEAASVFSRAEPTPKQSKKFGAEVEKRTAQVKKSAEDQIKGLREKANKKLGEIDEKIDAELAAIEEVYTARIDEAKLARDELIAAADDQAVADILAAKGVKLEEGYTQLTRDFVRDGSINEELILKAANKRAESLFKSVTGTKQHVLETDVVGGVRGYMKQRKNPAWHADLMARRWALSDVMGITQQYSQTAGADSVLGKYFKKTVKTKDEAGEIQEILVADAQLSQVKAKIRQEYSQALEGDLIPADVRAKLVKKHADDPEALDLALREETLRRSKMLTDAAKQDEEAVDTLVAFMRGTNTAPGSERLGRSLEMLGIFNFVRLMGGQVISSLGDPINLVISQGLGNTIKHGVKPLMNDFAAAWKNADDDARSLARLAGANLEVEFNTTMAEIGGLTSPWVPKDSLTWARTMAEKFSAVSGIQFWNAFWKQVSYNTIQGRIATNSLRGWGSLSKAEQAWMASLGIDETRLGKIAAEYQSQPYLEKGGMAIAKWTDWKDKGTAEAFRAATYQESFNVVVTPALYDKLNAQSHPVGRTIMQFRNHMFANFARLVGRNVQLSTLDSSKAAGAFTGLVGLVMMGVLIDDMKQIMGSAVVDKETVGGAAAGAALGFGAGGLTGAATGAVVGAGVGSLAGDATGANGEDLWARISKQWDENPAQATYNAIDRVGVFGPVFEISNMMNKAGLGGVQGALRVMSGEDALGTSRTFNQNIFDLVGGASFGLVSDTANLGSRIGDWMTEEDFEPSLGDVRRAQRLMPGQSIPYLRPFISWGNQQVGTMYDWPTP